MSSPSDVEEERDKLGEVIDDLNRASKQTVLRLIRWETHGVPGIGSAPQDLLNKELSPEDADIFIGIMWMRYGTPTENAGSGTEEEFNRAFARHKEDPSANRIMFYFKTTPPSSLDDIDVGQLTRVREFQSSLKSHGIIWQFATLTEFEQEIRIHLSQQVQDFNKRQNPVAEAPAEYACGAEPDDELGLLDYLDIVAASTDGLVEIATGILEETETIGQRLSQRSREIESVTAHSDSPMAHSQSRSRLRTLINRAATDLSTFAVSVKTKLPLFDQQLSEGMKAAGQVAILSVIDLKADRQQIVETKRALKELYNGVGAAIESMIGFRNSVRNLPRMTSKLNKAKQQTAYVLQQIISSLKSGRETIAEALRALGG